MVREYLNNIDMTYELDGFFMDLHTRFKIGSNLIKKLYELTDSLLLCYFTRL